MADPFEPMLAQELPEGSGLDCIVFGYDQSRQAEFEALLRKVEAVCTFRGHALERRVLAAHPPKLPSGCRDDAIISAQPLASAALLSLYTDICRQHPLFAPLVLGRDCSTPAQILALLTDVRSAVEGAERCSMMWARHVFAGFVKLSAHGDPTGAVQATVEALQARAEVEVRRVALLAGHASLAAAAAAGAPVKLTDVEDFGTALLTALGAGDDGAELAALRCAVEALAAAQPGQALCAEAFACSRGVALLAVTPHSASAPREGSALAALVKRSCRRGEEGLGLLLHRALAPPRALALLFGPLKGQCSDEFIPVLWKAYEGVGEAKDAAAVVAALQQTPPRGMDPLPPRALRVLQRALSERLPLRLGPRGLPFPDAFRDAQWFSGPAAEVRLAIYRTGVFEVPQSLAQEVGGAPASAQETLAAIEACLSVMAEHWWMLQETMHSRHPFKQARSIAIDLLAMGAALAGSPRLQGGPAGVAQRFLGHWDAVLGMPQGPPPLCADGYEGCVYDSRCRRCGMPAELCPSLHRLRSELALKMAGMGVPAQDCSVSVRDAGQAAGFFQGPVFLEEGPIRSAVQGLKEEGALLKEGGGSVPWHFAGEPRPVGLEYREGEGTVLYFMQ